MHRFYLPVSISFSQFLRPIIPSLDFGTPQVIVNYLMRVTIFFLDIFQDTTCFKNLQGKKILAGNFTLFKAINICFDVCHRIKKQSLRGNFAEVAARLGWGTGEHRSWQENDFVLFPTMHDFKIIYSISTGG